MTPAQKSLHARMAAHVRWSGAEDPQQATAAARAKGPGQLAYWERKVDPDDSLPQGERTRRAEHAKKAHFARLAIASAQARGRRSSGSTMTRRDEAPPKRGQADRSTTAPPAATAEKARGGG